MKKAYAIWVAAGLLVGFAIGYGLLPKGSPGIPTQGQIRRIIREYPGDMRLEVKPGSVEFLTLSPGFMEDRRVWFVEYACEARIIPLPGMSTPSFTKRLALAVIDAYSGRRLRIWWQDMTPMADILDYYEVKPGSVRFENLTLEFREGKKAWVARYECEGRPRLDLIWSSTMSIPPFTRIGIQVVTDARTGEKYEVWCDLEPRTVDLMTDKDVRNLIMKDRWFHPNYEYNLETLEFRSLALICLSRVLQVYIWVIDFGIEGRFTGIQGYAVPFDECPSSTEVIRIPPFRRMWSRVVVDARSGRAIARSIPVS